jgi:hypothetical protein
MKKITLTEQDAQRLESLLQCVVRAFHQIIEARTKGGKGRKGKMQRDDLDFDLPEMLVYEKAFELERSLPPGNWD